MTTDGFWTEWTPDSPPPALPWAYARAYQENRAPTDSERKSAIGQMLLEVVDTSAWIYGDNGHEALKFLVSELISTVDSYWPDRGPAMRTPIPYALSKVVFERDAYRCQTCDDWHNLSVDHVIPVSKGGPTVLSNLRTLCRSCNSRKGGRLE